MPKFCHCEDPDECGAEHLIAYNQYGYVHEFLDGFCRILSNEKKYNSYGFCERLDHLKIGDYLKFTAISQNGFSIAKDIEKCNQPVKETEIKDNKIVVIKDHITRELEVSGDCGYRAFRTDFCSFAIVDLNTDLGQLPANDLIGKTVKVEIDARWGDWVIREIVPGPEKRRLVGYCYATNRMPHFARVWVPGYPMDFEIPPTEGKFIPREGLYRWIGFTVITATNQFDATEDIVWNVEPIHKVDKGNNINLYFIPCNRKDGIWKTVHGDTVVDTDNVMAGRGVALNCERVYLSVYISSDSHRSPLFKLHSQQPNLPAPPTRNAA